MMRFNRLGITLTMLFALVVACSDDPTGTDSSPLLGLQQRAGNDSAGNPPPPPPAQPTAGSLHGTVLGPAAPGSGNDSLTSMPRIAGVAVTAYPKLADGDPPQVGPGIASDTTGADGTFQFPTLPGGEYVVTFNPPSSSEYGGVYVTATVSAQSNSHPWWVVLWKK